MARTYGVPEDEAIRLATCESNLNPRAKNPISSAKGIYQFLDGTWEWIGAEGHQFDYVENIRMFMIYYQRYPTWWSECL